MTEQRWTSDHLVTEQGVKLYADQVRVLFRGYAEDFRTLAREVSDDYKADPIEGDRWPLTALHARQLSGALREMADHAQGIVKAAKKLEAGHRKVRIELPRAREQKALRKARKRELLEQRRRGELPGGVAGRVAAAASGQELAAQDSGDGKQLAPTPFADLFREAR